MRKTASPSPARIGKQRLLAGCAIAAGLAAIALGGPALAQVAGSGSIVSGGGTITPPGPGATTVTTTTPQTIVHWTPTDTAPTGGAIDFLPTGNTLNFVGTGSYTVLNRFVDGSGGIDRPPDRAQRHGQFLCRIDNRSARRQHLVL